MTPEQFASLMGPVMDFVAGRPADDALAEALNHRFPAGGAEILAVEFACNAAIKAGWMCAQGGGGRKFGRVIPASAATRGLSVDVADLTDMVAPRHRHPNGEICLVMPVDDGATFDGRRSGWCVYGPASSHRAAARGGRVLVLSLLPGGGVEFVE